MTQSEERPLLLPKKVTAVLDCFRSYKFASIHSKGALVALLMAALFEIKILSTGGKRDSKTVCDECIQLSSLPDVSRSGTS